MIATAVAHPNIALVKYWGKREHSLNLPAAGSLSVTLGPMSTRTRVSFGVVDRDRFVLNGQEQGEKETARISRFVDLIRALRPDAGFASIDSTNDFPTAAGLASSSSGFAALALAASTAAGLDLDRRTLSVLARRGSGSAARSIDGGFVRMAAGSHLNGEDAYATPIFAPDHWDLHVVIAVTTEKSKDVPSTDGMNLTQRTSPYFDAWVRTVDPAIEAATEAIAARDFARLAEVAEASALQMHASAMAAVPGVIYYNGTTIDVVHAVRAMRGRDGLPVFFTIDAGPHVKVFTEAASVAEVERRLRELPGVVRTIHATPAGAARIVERVA
jgi:diphosphomevalonate decarboxylase